MGRRRIDWLQLILVLLTILGAAVHTEHRIAQVEQHLVDADRDNALIQSRLAQIEGKLER